MKNILLTLLAVCTLAACGKDDKFETEYERLEGFWLLTDITGGFSGMGYEADFDHLQINEDQRYSLMVHDSFIQEGTYELKEENGEFIIQFKPSESDTIGFDDYDKTITFGEGNNLLTLRDPCCDLFVYTFEKE